MTPVAPTPFPSPAAQSSSRATTSFKPTQNIPPSSSSSSSTTSTASTKDGEVCAGGAGQAILNAGKQVGSFATGIVQAIGRGVGSSLQAVGSLVHSHNEADNVKSALEVGETVGKQVRHHGFRLAYPDWLEVTLGTVVGCSVCVEPMPPAQKAVAQKKAEEEAPPSGQAAALLKMFTKALKSVENSTVTLQKNNAHLNSLDLMVADIGLGVPSVSVIINLDRR
jgi:hypothetical protein